MSMIPGNTLEKAIFNDGLQSDHLSENTVGHGVSIQGRTSGVAIESGYVGEKASIAVPSFAGSTTRATIQTVCSLTIPSAGYWDIYLSLTRSLEFTALSGGYGMFAILYLYDSATIIAEDAMLVPTGTLRGYAPRFLHAPALYCSSSKTLDLKMQYNWWAGTETFTCSVNYAGPSNVSGNGFYAIRRY